MKDNLKQLIIKYLEAEGEASKSKIEDYLKELKGTTGDCCSRRLRELVASGVVVKEQKEYADKTYFAYRISKYDIRSQMAEIQREFMGQISDKIQLSCSAEDMHPYNCDTEFGGTCKHCKREKTETHDPATCCLCDPEYDYQPNPYWIKPTKELKLNI